jgi:hypothetical protein
MSRDEVQGKAEKGGFIEYDESQLPKVDSMRRDKTQPDFYGIPIIQDSDVGFVKASEIGNRPVSCYTCSRQNRDETCFLIGPEVKVSTVVGHRESGDPIEYWPCCSAHNYGDPSKEVSYANPLSSPNTLGLIWINAPKVGLEYSGANCGGVNDGDDCDHYIVKSGEKWDNPQGYCRVLAHVVDAADVCGAWRDDDQLDWDSAQQLMKGDTRETVDKKKLAKEIVGRDDA